MTAMVDVLHPSYQAEELLKNQGREHPVENLSYLCKICSKRFVSGRALGGHMRAHVPLSMPAYKRPRVSDDKSMDEKVDKEGLDGNGSNLLYALQSWRFADWDDSFLLGQGLDSNPIDSSLNCDLCGKEFSSWKGLFGHKNCHCETHQDSGDAQLEESHKHETHDEEEQGSETDAEIDHPRGNSRKFDKWMKGKGFKRPRYALQLNPCKQFVSETNNEEEDMAMCLVMLASGINTAQTPQFQEGAADLESGDLKLPNKSSQLPKSIQKKPKYKKIDGETDINADEAKKGRLYKCTTCSKVFLSYQALGGHRASHNKGKGSLTQIEDQNLQSLEEEITDEELNTGLDSQLPCNFHKPPPKERTKDSCVKARDETGTVEPAVFSGKKTLRVHGCSICHRVFASGQALGGHKRCHLGSTGASDTSTTSSSNKETPMQQQMPARVEMLDLNLPAPVDDDCDAGNLNNLGNKAVDSDGASYAQTHSRPYLLSLLMGNHQKEGGLFLYDTDSHVSKDDEADNKVGKDIGLDSKLGLGKDIGFGGGCNLEFPMRALSWLQL